MFLLWAIWYNLSNKWYNWRYKPENDKARKWEKPREFSRTENVGFREPVIDIPTTTGTDAGSKLEASNPIKTRQDSKGFRGFFAKRRRK